MHRMYLPEGIFYAFFLPDVPYEFLFSTDDIRVIGIISVLVRRSIDRDVES